MKAITYNQLTRLIDRITKDTQPLNDKFSYYGHSVVLQSNTRDYVDVRIDRKTHFSFDFWTKKLNIFTVQNEDLKAFIKSAFVRIYGKIK